NVCSVIISLVMLNTAQPTERLFPYTTLFRSYDDTDYCARNVYFCESNFSRSSFELPWCRCGSIYSDLRSDAKGSPNVFNYCSLVFGVSRGGNCVDRFIIKCVG